MYKINTTVSVLPDVITLCMSVIMCITWPQVTMYLGDKTVIQLTAVSSSPSMPSTSHQRRWISSTTMSHPSFASEMITWDTGDQQDASVMPRQSTWTAVTSCAVGGVTVLRRTRRASDATARSIGAARSRARFVIGRGRGTCVCSSRQLLPVS